MAKSKRHPTRAKGSPPRPLRKPDSATTIHVANLAGSAFACLLCTACQQLNPTKAAIREGVGGCTQQELQRKRWDLDPLIQAQTIAVIVIAGSVLSTPNPAGSRYVIGAGSCISRSHCSSSSHSSLLCSIQCTFLTSLSETH